MCCYDFKPGESRLLNWSLKIAFVCKVGMHACMVRVSIPRLLITSSIIWTQYDWLAKFYSLYIVAIVTIIISVALQLKGIVEIRTKEQASTV